jgi:hypothetical protein
MPLQPTEIRINNVIQYNGELLTVHSYDFANLDWSKAEGIGLTATILEQAGFNKGKPFEKTGHVPYHDKQYKGFVIIDCLDGTFWLADYKPYDVKIEFVHWLQNVYYFLIGSELNINL